MGEAQQAGGQEAQEPRSLAEWLVTPVLAGLRGRDFLSLRDFSPAELQALIGLARTLKACRQRGEPTPVLTGRSLAMIFQKPSTRTRVAFEVGMFELGGQALYLNAADLQLGRGESIADTARVLSRFVHAILIRTYSQDEVEELARYASVPVINGLTDLLHPTQVLADLITLTEKWGKLAGHTMAYVGDGNNMAHSLLFGAALTGLHLRVATPPDYPPQAAILEQAQALAQRWRTGAQLVWTTDSIAAVAGAHAVYTDTWVSMGQEQGAERKRAVLRPYQLNLQLLNRAAAGALVLHCLPAHRGEEATDEVLDGPTSVIFDEAENRLHAHKAILTALLAGGTALPAS
ncbi:MAG: ornithine carbamoyltransferase [Limnochordaceae bacterium]|nr:ornithine carbamoyltransferase [Limnochordaceae bacterium]